MYTLYARKSAGSAAVEAVLALLGQPCELVEVPRNAQGRLPDDFACINPRREVPALRLPDGSIMTESAAMLIWLADLHPQAGLAPAPDDPARAPYLRWMLYLATTLYMSDLRYYYPGRYTRDGDGEAAIKATAADAMAGEFAVLAEAVGDGPFLLGERLSAADIYAAMLINWAPDLGALFEGEPRLAAYYARVTALPQVAAVWARNGM